MQAAFSISDQTLYNTETTNRLQTCSLGAITSKWQPGMAPKYGLISYAISCDNTVPAAVCQQPRFFVQEACNHASSAASLTQGLLKVDGQSAHARDSRACPTGLSTQKVVQRLAQNDTKLPLGRQHSPLPASFAALYHLLASSIRCIRSGHRALTLASSIWQCLSCMARRAYMSRASCQASASSALRARRSRWEARGPLSHPPPC